MKKILVIVPHFPPSNLAGVHRPRLFAQHLSSFGWEPVILTVHEKYYEEIPDWNLVKLLSPNLRIEKVAAYKVTRPRLVGDIGLRAFFQLYKKAQQLIKSESFDFVYISIPSFYSALLGRWLHRSTGIKYGIDYIDPWVHDFPGSNKIFSRHWLSKKMAALLEPIAVKKASLITGVAEGYYTPVLERNPHLKTGAISGAMPYGAEVSDHALVKNLKTEPYLFKKKPGAIQLVYAGAMLPKAYKPLEAVFKAMNANMSVFDNVEFHFIGTGSRADDAGSYNIKPLAEKHGLWNTTVYEYPKRIPYLDVLIHLQNADGIFILGSTEPHYTPSKTYQAILSGRYILAVLHRESTAVKAVASLEAGEVLSFGGEADLVSIENEFAKTFSDWNCGRKKFLPERVNMEVFDAYSAKAITKKLAGLLDEAMRIPLQ